MSDDAAKAAGWTDLAIAESWLGSNSHPVKPEHRVAIRAELARLRLVEQAATTLVEHCRTGVGTSPGPETAGLLIALADALNGSKSDA